MKINLLLLLILICWSGAAIKAQTSLSLYTGTSFTNNSDLRIQQPSRNTDATFSQVSWAARPFHQAPYYGIRVSHFFRRSSHLGLSFDFTHYKIYARTDRFVSIKGVWNGVAVNESVRMDTRVQSFAISHGANMGGVNLLYRWMKLASASFPNGRLQPYVGAGPVYYVPHSESTINNRATNGRYQGSGFGYQFLGGIQYGLRGRLGVFGEVKFNSGHAKVDTADQGRADTNLRTWHTLAGFNVRF